MQNRFFILLLAALPFISVAQKKVVVNDSLALDKSTSFLKQIDSVHRADSLKRMDLQREIERLKGTDNNKEREALMQQLRKAEVEDSIKKQKKLQKLQELKTFSVGFLVAPFGDTLFIVCTRIGSFSAKDRAAAISGKIEKLYEDYEFSPDSLAVNISETAPEIVYRDLMVMSVNELEALWYDKTPDALANQYKTIIQNAIRQERSNNSLINIALRVLAIVLIVVGIYVVIKLVNRLFIKANERIRKWKDRYLKGIRFKNYRFLDSERELQVILFLVNIFRLLIILLALYIALPLLFSVFPWTRGIAETLFSYILNPAKQMALGLWNYLPNLITIIVIVFVFRYALKGIHFLKTEIEKDNLRLPSFYADWANPTYQIVKVAIYAFMVIVIFPYLPGSDSPVFQGISVFLGVLFTFGSSGSLSNVVAGLVLTYMRLFKIGDRVKIGDVVGDVIEKTLLVTRVRTIKNEIISVPNSTVMNSHTINYSSDAEDKGLIMHTTVTIGYDVPWKDMHKALLNAAHRTDLLLKDPKPFVLQTSLDDFYVSYQINAYTKEAGKQATIYSQLHSNIQDCCNEAGIEILSPHYRAARDGNTTTIPASYLPKDYKAPAFNVSMENASKEKKE